MNRSPEAQEIAKHLLTHVLVRPERRMGAELINAAKNLARLGAINAALEALRLVQLDQLRRSAFRKLKLELRTLLKSSESASVNSGAAPPCSHPVVMCKLRCAQALCWMRCGGCDGLTIPQS